MAEDFLYQKPATTYLPMTMTRLAHTVGADPELLLMGKDGMGVPASKLIPEEYRATLGRVGPDNAAVELRPSPSSCLEYLQRNIRSCVGSMNRKLDKDVRPTLAPMLEYRMKDLKKYNCLEFGCSPSHYLTAERNIEMVQQKVNPEDYPFRTAGYHVHLGFATHIAKALNNNPDHKDLPILINLMDIFLGLPGVILEDQWRSEANARRQVVGYGLPGEFRIQPHGIEYRALGPWPLAHPIWTWWVGSTARAVSTLFFYRKFLRIDFRSFNYREEIFETIMEGDKERALQIWEACCNRLRPRLEEYVEAARKSYKHYYSKAAGNTYGLTKKPCRGTAAFRSGNDTLHPDNLAGLDYTLRSKNPLGNLITSVECDGSAKNMIAAWSGYRDHTANAWAGTLRRNYGKNDELQERIDSVEYIENTVTLDY